jgi:hypothetical protein
VERRLFLVRCAQFGAEFDNVFE